MKWKPRTRGGYEFRIYTDDGMDKEFPLVGEVKEGLDRVEQVIWNKQGTALRYRDHDLLPATVIQPCDIPWGSIAPEIKWVAMDKDGSWCGFSTEPNFPNQPLPWWSRASIAYIDLTCIHHLLPRVDPEDWREAKVRRPE